jgi:hypothetical protein
MLAAAACAFAAGNAIAQSYEAEIPFTFRAGRVNLAPGRYQVWIDPASSVSLIRLHNMDSRETVLLLPASVAGAGRYGQVMKLQFRCGGARCALSSMSVGESQGAYTFHTPALGRDDAARVAEIVLTPVKAD